MCVRPGGGGGRRGQVARCVHRFAAAHARNPTRPRADFVARPSRTGPLSVRPHASSRLARARAPPAGDPERVSEAELSAALGALRGAALCFDSGRYLSALRAGDAWVAVGWSSDVVPTASRSPTTIGHVAPETGSPLWADVFVAPAATESHGGARRCIARARALHLAHAAL